MKKTNDLINDTLTRLDKGLKTEFNNDNKYIVVAGFLSHEFTSLMIKLTELEKQKDNEINSLKEKIKVLEKKNIKVDVEKAIAEKINSAPGQIKSA